MASDTARYSSENLNAPRISQTSGIDVARTTASPDFSFVWHGHLAIATAAVFTKHYALTCFDQPEIYWKSGNAS
jgi:hypothetical protein